MTSQPRCSTMHESNHKLRTIAVLIFLQQCVSGQQTRDITTNPEFGCRWTGGNSPGLVCICRSEVQDFSIEANSIPAFNLERITIDSCNKVQFGSNAINRIRNLRLLELSNIGELLLDESSLVWNNYNVETDYNIQWDINIPSLRILIKNSHIAQISSYTFKGLISEITFDNVAIDNIAPFAFSSLQQNSNIRFLNSHLRNVQAQAFKKFSTENLEIIATRVEFLPSRAFSEIQVNQNVRIQNSSFETIRPSAFFITNPTRLEVTQTYFNQLDGEAFRVSMRGDALFRGNTFNNTNDFAFRGITPDQAAERQTSITFDSNHFNTLTLNSLRTSELVTPKFATTILNETCDCKHIAYNYNSDFYDQIHCVSDEGVAVTAEEYKRGCSIIESHATLIIAVGVVLLVFILVTSGIVFYLKKVRNSDKYGSEKTSKNGGKMSLIVPDGRTYRETELHVVVERADLLTTDL